MRAKQRSPRPAEGGRVSEPDQPQPVTLVFDLPERTERLECPDLYAGHWIEVVTNSPPSQSEGKPLSEFMASVIKAWSFQTRDGHPAPISAEAMQALPPDLWDWLIAEYVERRARPLAQRQKASPPPTA
jgi:hypothetical protein